MDSVPCKRGACRSSGLWNKGFFYGNASERALLIPIGKKTSSAKQKVLKIYLFIVRKKTFSLASLAAPKLLQKRHKFVTHIAKSSRQVRGCSVPKCVDGFISKLFYQKLNLIFNLSSTTTRRSANPNPPPSPLLVHAREKV